jgi:hypothetical protein
MMNAIRNGRHAVRRIHQVLKLFANSPGFGARCPMNNGRCGAFARFGAATTTTWYDPDMSENENECRIRPMCEEHARKFASRHQVTFPDQLELPVSPSEHAPDRVASAGQGR